MIVLKDGQRIRLTKKIVQHNDTGGYTVLHPAGTMATIMQKLPVKPYGENRYLIAPDGDGGYCATIGDFETV